MTRTGPQRYPGASTAYWYGSKYPGSAMESNVVVWHTTEGTSVPTYGGGASAPNFTAKPDFAAQRLVWYQHFDFDESSRALVNQPGGVETNTLNVVQVEIVGTCDPAAHKKWGSIPHLYTPELPDWVVRDLAAFARWAHEQHGVPLSSDVTFKAYPSSYGANGVRMSNAKWSSFKGHCGHQHVAENAHGDPGLLPMAAILARAAGTTTAPAPAPTKEADPMPAYTSLGMTEPMTLQPGEWKTIAFDTEWVDDLDQHYDGGQTFATGAHYNGVLYVYTDDLARGDELQIRLVEDSIAEGRTVKTFPPTEVIGSSGGTYSYIPAVGVIGKDRRVKFQIAHYGTGPLVLKRAELKAHLWKL
ncbi:hypothetical protein KVH30_02470 [Streptomyces olivaceus]|uniref:hypothetical protein n=1 Tax=Streptomyces olivaceus TaxID=47716 RepID=UPI001CCAFD3A|nr:hypothetical protein [Streptomyces olivaceus]MBZ6290438.1 hypothetical protein [Streptomyces olivaceus]MBZ6324390.1 hypothetical protein [Streptomyces olivaceus]